MTLVKSTGGSRERRLQKVALVNKILEIFRHLGAEASPCDEGFWDVVDELREKGCGGWAGVVVEKAYTLMELCGKDTMHDWINWGLRKVRGEDE